MRESVFYKGGANPLNLPLSAFKFISGDSQKPDKLRCFIKPEGVYGSLWLGKLARGANLG